MLRRPDLVERFEREMIRSTPPDFERNLRIVEALYEEARALGVFPPTDPLDGVDVDVKLAQALSVRPPT